MSKARADLGGVIHSAALRMSLKRFLIPRFGRVIIALRPGDGAQTRITIRLLLIVSNILCDFYRLPIQLFSIFKIDGGTGDDQIFGGAGNDVIFGSDGNDKIDGGLGTDQLHGGAGNDTIYGDKNLYMGPHGNVNINYLPEHDVIFGDDGDDLIYGLVSDMVDGGAGNNGIYTVTPPRR
jgi:hypothetical protein